MAMLASKKRPRRVGVLDLGSNTVLALVLEKGGRVLEECSKITRLGQGVFAAGRLEEVGIKLLIEPINTVDIPGFYLCHTAQALDIIDKVGSGNLYLQYDIYHMQIMEGDLTRTIEHNLSRIAHMQLADNPGRHEPGSGEINYTFLFDFLDRIGYEGWIGCEYKPATTTGEGLGWFAPCP